MGNLRLLVAPIMMSCAGACVLGVKSKPAEKLPPKPLMGAKPLRRPSL